MNLGPLDRALDALAGARVPASVANAVKAHDVKVNAARVKGVDKSDRATVEQAIDPRTRMVGQAVDGADRWKPTGLSFCFYGGGGTSGVVLLHL